MACGLAPDQVVVTGSPDFDELFDHDVIGILVTLMTMGDFSRIREYAEFIMKNPQYPDARWKYSWVFAVWLFKTGDKSFAREKFAMIKENARRIGKDIDADADQPFGIED